MISDEWAQGVAEEDGGIGAVERRLDGDSRRKEYWAERAAHLLQMSVWLLQEGRNAEANLYRTLFRVAMQRCFECPD